MKALLPLLAIATAIAPHAAAQVTDASADPFAGRWMIAFPDTQGVIVNRPDATCENPAVIEKTGPHSMRVRTPGGDMGEWKVKAFGGRNPWWRDDNQSVVAEWKTDDVFLLAGKDSSGIRSDWANARQWTRCK